MAQPLSSLISSVLHPQPGMRRELAILAACLAVGLLLVPLAIWITGRATLGVYANGGPFALWLDFMRGLAAGALPYWAVAAGPYLGCWLLRGLAAALGRFTTGTPS